MPTAVIAGTLITIVAALGMVGARLLGGRAWWHYAAGGAAAVAAAGAWIGSMSAGLATSVSPTTALLRGAGYGALYGFLSSLVLLGCLRILTRLREQEEQRGKQGGR